eukprot:m.281309 g.281309  ORF g.281309 m.281309 type:complete len:50 (-) comp152275_c0_seq1:114-263(-)
MWKCFVHVPSMRIVDTLFFPLYQCRYPFSHTKTTITPPSTPSPNHQRRH